jgi:endonuclease I
MSLREAVISTEREILVSNQPTQWATSLLKASLAILLGAQSTITRATDYDYEAPAGYYSPAAGKTGAALQSQLRTIMSTGLVQRNYGDFRYASAVLDADPNHAGNILLVYNRASVSATWDSGDTWSREHLWPVSLLGTDDPTNTQKDMRTDEFLLRPVTPSLNSARSNEYYGAVSGSGTYHDYGSYWFPGDPDKGDIARSMFYAVTEYPTFNGNNLSLVNGSPATYQMGDLNALLHWHYSDTPDAFERRRNQAVYSSTLNPTYYQGNRNAFIDHPEYVWSVVVDQANDTSITTSTHSVNLGRVIVGSSFGTQPVTINKTGQDGTYYEVRTAGSATSTVTGRYNAFAMDGAGSKQTTVGLNASTATAGLKSGAVTVDNLDITTQGGAGKGANDADDVVNVSGAVLDHAAPSFFSETRATSITLDFGSIEQNTGKQSRPVDLFNLMQTSGYTARLDLDSISYTGDSGIFSSTLATFLNLDAGNHDEFSILCDTAHVGSFSGAYSLICSDENIAGAQTFAPLTLTVVAHVLAVPEPSVVAMCLGALGALSLARRVRRKAGNNTGSLLALCDDVTGSSAVHGNA